MNVIVARLIRAVLFLLIKSCRVKTFGLDLVEEAAKKGPVLIALWHEELVPLAEILKPLGPKLSFTAFVSKSRDGKLLSSFISTYSSADVVEVPHNARGAALKAMINRLTYGKKIGLITPDGPRGPRRELKEGLVTAARQSGATIIPFYWRSPSPFTLSTWDRLKIPKPFSSIEAHFGPALSWYNPDLAGYLSGRDAFF